MSGQQISTKVEAFQRTKIRPIHGGRGVIARENWIEGNKVQTCGEREREKDFLINRKITYVKNKRILIENHKRPPYLHMAWQKTPVQNSPMIHHYEKIC